MSKQVYKGQVLTLTRAVNSIERFYNESTTSEVLQGLNWYGEANEYAHVLAAKFGHTVAQVAGIIAAFSPQTNWTSNKRFALTYFQNPNLVLRSKTQIYKADRIKYCKDESVIYEYLALGDKAWKSKAFYSNILRPNQSGHVTIDRHAIAICIQHPDRVEPLPQAHGSLTARQYLFFEQAYKKVASDIGILGHQLQAITWITYRRLRELQDHKSEMEWKPYLKEAI